MSVASRTAKRRSKILKTRRLLVKSVISSFTLWRKTGIFLKRMNKTNILRLPLCLSPWQTTSWIWLTNFTAMCCDSTKILSTNDLRRMQPLTKSKTPSTMTLCRRVKKSQKLTFKERWIASLTTKLVGYGSKLNGSWKWRRTVLWTLFSRLKRECMTQVK